MSLSIRPAATADADQLGKVHVAAWQWAYRGLMPDDLLDSLRPQARARLWKRWLEDPADKFSAIVAEIDGEIVGFASSGTSTDDDIPDDAVELLAIYLLQEHVGTGVGSRLLQAIEATWIESGTKFATLWVLEKNTNTRRFYERHGWIAEGGNKSSDPSLGSVSGAQVRYCKELV